MGPYSPKSTPHPASIEPPISDNLANDPAYLDALLDRMERDPAVRKAVHNLFRSGDLSFLMHDTQLRMTEMAETTASKEILLLSSRQLGKSFWGLSYGISYCLKNPKSIVRIFAPTELQAAEICDDTLRVIQQFAPEGLIVRKKSDKRWAVGKSEIRIGPLSQAHIDGKRGGNAGLIICEEGGFVSSEAYASALGAVIGPQLLRSGGKLVHVSTVSEDANHLLHTVILPKCEAKGAVARFTVYDNPQLTPELITGARERCLTEEQWLREYMVQIIRSEISSAVPEFSDTTVVECDPPTHANYWIGGDWGGVRDATVLLLFAYDFDRAKVLVLDECAFDKHTSSAEVVRVALAMEARWKLTKVSRFVDCPHRTDLMKDHQYAVTFPTKPQTGFEANINAVRSVIRRGDLEIHPRCKFLISTLRYQRLNKSRTDFERTEKFFHADAVMALVYGLRHVNKSNPHPAYGGADPRTHYIPATQSKTHSQSAQTLLSLFQVKR